MSYRTKNSKKTQLNKKILRKTRKNRKTRKVGGKQKIQTLFQPSLLDPSVIRYKTLITGDKDITVSDEVEEYLQSLLSKPNINKAKYLKETIIEYQYPIIENPSNK